MDHSYSTERERLQKTDHSYFTVGKKTPIVVLRKAAQQQKSLHDTLIVRPAVDQDHSYTRQQDIVNDKASACADSQARERLSLNETHFAEPPRLLERIDSSGEMNESSKPTTYQPYTAPHNTPDQQTTLKDEKYNTTSGDDKIEQAMDISTAAYPENIIVITPADIKGSEDMQMVQHIDDSCHLTSRTSNKQQIESTHSDYERVNKRRASSVDDKERQRCAVNVDPGIRTSTDINGLLETELCVKRSSQSVECLVKTFDDSIFQRPRSCQAHKLTRDVQSRMPCRMSNPNLGSSIEEIDSLISDISLDHTYEVRLTANVRRRASRSPRQTEVMHTMTGLGVVVPMEMMNSKRSDSSESVCSSSTDMATARDVTTSCVDKDMNVTITSLQCDDHNYFPIIDDEETDHNYTGTRMSMFDNSDEPSLRSDCRCYSNTNEIDVDASNDHSCLTISAVTNLSNIEQSDHNYLRPSRSEQFARNDHTYLGRNVILIEPSDHTYLASTNEVGKDNIMNCGGSEGGCGYQLEDHSYHTIDCQ